MTVCPYGAEPKPGAPGGAWLTLQGILSLLPSALNGWLAWAPDWLDGAYVSTSDLCAAPQPVVGAFPASDYLACQLAPIANYGGSCAVVRSWFNTYVRALLWANQCQCAASSSEVCPRPDLGHTQVVKLNSGDGRSDVAIPSGVSHFRTIRCLVDAPPFGSDPTGQILVWVPGGTIYYQQTIHSLPFTPTATSFADIDRTLYPSATHISLYTSSGVVGRAYSHELDLDMCGTVAATPASPPATPGQPSGVVSLPSGSCSTTADLCAELLRIEQYVSELTATVGYLTRQLAPYSYTFGTPSSGLSGTGYVAVSECMGVLVTLTTIPATKGRQSGTPTRYFDCGRINWGDVNGYHAHHPIHESPELILGIPDTATRVGYTFPSGVVATITPVKRA